MKKKFYLIIFIFGCSLSGFLYFYIFQHPIFISKRALLASAILGFLIPIILSISVRKNILKINHNQKVNKKHALRDSLICMVLVLVLFDIPTNFLLAPTVDLSISLPARSGNDKALISYVDNGLKSINLHKEEVILESNATQDEDGILLHPSSTEEATVRWRGRAWEQISVTFSEFVQETQINFTVNGNKDTIELKSNSQSKEFTTFLDVPAYTILRIASFSSIAACIFLCIYSSYILCKRIVLENREHTRIAAIFLFVILIIIIVLGNMITQSPLYRYPNIDSATYIYVGAGILEGKIPYRDIWDNKGPILFFINAIGSSLGIGNWGIWLIELIFLLCSCYFFVKILEGELSYLPLFVLLLFYIRSFILRLQGGNFTEEYSACFFVLNILLFKIQSRVNTKKRILILLLIGAIAACCILLRPNMISSSAAVIFFIFLNGITEKKLLATIKDIAFIAGGFLLIFGLVCGYFLINGALVDFLDAVFYYNFFYSNTPEQNILVNMGRAFELYPIQMHAASISVMFILFVKIFSRKEINRNHVYLLYVTILGFLIEIFLFNLSGRSYAHYYLGLFPYIFLLIGFAISLGKTSINYELNITNKEILIFPMFFIFILLGSKELITNIKSHPVKDDLTYEEIGEITEGAQYLEIWGYGTNYHLILDKQPSSRYVYHHPLYVCDYVDTDMVNELIDGVEEKRPIIIDSLYDDTTFSLDPDVRISGNACEPLMDFYNYFEFNYHEILPLSNGYVVYEHR